MKKSMIHCHCGERVMSREVLRTDFYERPNGKDYVYVKYRCRHCKQIGESFIPERRFSWDMFENPRDELSEQERESLKTGEAISSTDVLDLHQFLKDEAASNISSITTTLSSSNSTARADGKSGKNSVEKKPEKKQKPLRTRGKPSSGDPFAD